jgi:hypothetical protein
MPRPILLLLAALTGGGLSAPLRSQVVISEFMAENPGQPIDPNAQLDMDANSPDWIEIRNTGAAATNLVGLALSDDAVVPGKWIFPSVSVAAGGQLVVYASGKNRAISGVQLHTNFKLAPKGVVLLSRPVGTTWVTVSQFGSIGSKYPKQRPGISYGSPSGNPLLSPGYFLSDTPGVINGSTIVTNFVGDTTFSVDRGFYDAPFSLVVSNKTAGATLVYTLNGSEPSGTNGVQVPPPNANTGPSVTLAISDSTIVRARGIKTGWGPSDIDTQTYVFWDRVRTQTGPLPTTGISQSDPLVTAPWGFTGGTPRTPAGPDWEVDPMVVNTNSAASKFVSSDLKSIPSVSLVTPWKGLFGPSTSGQTDGGIYVGTEAGVANEGVDRVFSFEFFNPTGSTNLPNAVKGFHTLGKAHVFGGTSHARWKSYKLSLNFKAIQDVDYDVYGEGATQTHRTFILDSRMNQTWLHSDATQRAYGDYVRDPVVADLQNAVGGNSFHSRPVHLFLNGMYWGLYTLHERPDEKFMEDYLGDDADNWDVYKHTLSASTSDGSEVMVHGAPVNPSLPFSYANSTTLANFNSLMSLFGVTFAAPAPTKDLRTQANYNPIAARFDVPDFQSYMLVNFMAGNEDWSHKNYYSSLLRTDPAAKWRYQAWDSEHVFKNGTLNNTVYGSGNAGKTGSPHHFNHLLSTNAEYRISFADIAHRHMFNGGTLTVAGLQQAFTRRLDEIDSAIRGESARWGDNRRDATPYTRGAEWLTEKNRILNTVIPARHTSLLTQLQTAGLYPAINAPAFSTFGGAVTNLHPLAMTATAGHSIYYTLNGTDPREAWTSNSVGTLYTGPIPLTASGTVRARARNGTTWSALTEALFLVGTLASSNNLLLSEIHYNPDGPDDLTEFVELVNTSTGAIDLTNVRLDGVDFTFPIGYLLNPGQRTVVVRDLVAFQAAYGTGIPVAGVFQNGTALNNDGERLTVYTPGNQIIQDVDFPTPGNSDGGGLTLVRIIPSQGLSVPTHFWWRISAATNGCPGSSDAHVFSGTAGADVDDDGLPALVEYMLGTSDTNDQSGPPGIEITPAGEHVIVSHALDPVADDALLTLQTSTNLIDWAETASGIQFLPPSEVRRYYRLKATLR